MVNGTTRARRRLGVTLVETMALIIVATIAIPPLASLAVSSSRAVVDERRMFQTAWLATAVTEQIVADAASGEDAMTLEAMGDAAYAADLRARLATLSSAYEDVGVTYSIAFGTPVDAEGNAVDADDPTATRLVTVEARYVNELGREVVAPFVSVVARH